MKLIEFDGRDFKIADEAFLMSPIRELLEKDKTVRKENFWKQISYLWNMCDPRSPWMFLINEKDRDIEVKKQEGLPLDWQPSETLKRAMNIYKTQSTTTASLLIEDMRCGLDSIRAIIRKISKAVTKESEDNNDNNVLALKLDKALDSMTKACDKIPDLAKKLADAEKALTKDFETDDKARGNATKAIGEDI